MKTSPKRALRRLRKVIKSANVTARTTHPKLRPYIDEEGAICIPSSEPPLVVGVQPAPNAPPIPIVFPDEPGFDTWYAGWAASGRPKFAIYIRPSELASDRVLRELTARLNLEISQILGAK